jgi:Chaperone of endosialidase
MNPKSLNIIVIAVISIGLWSIAEAVSPPPDGGYPGGNTAEGTQALLNRSSGNYNSALGFISLKTLTTANFNTGVGAATLALNNGEENTATGAGAMLLNGTGGGNTANGALALFMNSTGTENTAVGDRALQNNTAGSGNTAIGSHAGLNTTGSSNIVIGHEGVGGESNTIRIGDSQTATFIFGIRNNPSPIINSMPVLIDANGQLGVVLSSERFKRDVQPMDEASEAVLALQPVKFHYKNDDANQPQFGLIAEQVAKVNPELVVRDDKGEIYSVRYDAVNAMLLNEFLKEHRKVQEMEKALADVTRQLKEQAAQIQKVNARLQVDKSIATQVVTNP